MNSRLKYLAGAFAVYLLAAFYVSQLEVSTFRPTMHPLIRQTIAFHELAGKPLSADQEKTKQKYERAESEWPGQIARIYDSHDSARFAFDRTLEWFVTIPVSIYRFFVPTEELVRFVNADNKPILTSPGVLEWAADVVKKFVILLIVVYGGRYSWRRIRAWLKRELEAKGIFGDADFELNPDHRGETKPAASAKSGAGPSASRSTERAAFGKRR